MLLLAHDLFLATEDTDDAMGLIVILLIAVLSLAWLLLFIATVVSIARSPADSTGKALWLLIALLFPLVGSLFWFIVGKGWSRDSQGR